MDREVIDLSGGAYVTAGMATYHIATDGEKVAVRLVDMHGGSSTGRLTLFMPASNVAEIVPAPTEARP